MVLPYHFALYSNISTNSDQDASVINFARWWFLTMFFTCKSSKQITWFSSISLVDNLWRKSRLAFTIFSWIWTTSNRALFQLDPPFWRRDKIYCHLASFFSYFLKYFGALIFLPVERITKSFNPRSTPTAFSEVGNDLISVSQEIATKYLPDGLRRIVAEMIFPLTSLDFANVTYPNLGSLIWFPTTSIVGLPFFG